MRTITKVLVNDRNDSIFYTSIDNVVCRMYSIPRSEIEYVNTQGLLDNNALYVLIDEDADSDEDRLAYIGETDSFKNRIKQHIANKSFWTRAYAFIATDFSLTKADVRYLEYLAIRTASLCESFVLENNTNPPEPNLLEHDRARNIRFFEVVKLLLGNEHCPIFERKQNKQSQPKILLNNDSQDSIVQVKKYKFKADVKNNIFNYIRKNKLDKEFYEINAKTIVSEEGFKLLKGSIISKVPEKSGLSNRYIQKRESFIEQNCIIKDNTIVLDIDLIFDSPSAVAQFCSGQGADGWFIWRDNNNNYMRDYRIIEE